MTLDFEIPGLAVRSAANLREHWGQRTRRVQCERKNLRIGLVAAGVWAQVREMAKSGGPFHVQLTRISPRLLDDDNAIGGFKAIRDQLAEELGVDDGSVRISFAYSQEKGPIGVRIRVECGGLNG